MFSDIALKLVFKRLYISPAVANKCAYRKDSIKRLPSNKRTPSNVPLLISAPIPIGAPF